MAKKPSSGSKRSKKSVDSSAVKGGGIMSLNKSNTSPFMKFVIVLIIISMVMLFLYGGISGLIELFKPQPKAPAPDQVALLQQQYEPQLQTWNTVLASQPTSYGVLVRLGSTHYDYAIELSRLASQNSTAAAAAADKEWATARDVYKRAVKANKNAPSPDLIDYSITVFYSGDATGAVKIAEGVAKKDPTFAPAFYNLGVFYEAVNRKDLAIAAFQKYILVDPNGLTGTPSYAVQQLKTLGGSIPSTASLTTTP